MEVVAGGSATIHVASTTIGNGKPGTRNTCPSTVAVNGWNWLALLGLAAVVYVAIGTLAFGVLLEES